MEHIRNQMANRTTELRLYLDFESRPELIQSVRMTLSLILLALGRHC